MTIGLVWGLASLDARRAVERGTAPAAGLDKVIIILTDGYDTEAWKNPNNTKGTSSSAIDQRTALACTKIKATNIEIQYQDLCGARHQRQLPRG